MGKSHYTVTYSFCHFRENFNGNLSTAHYDTNSTDSDEIIKAYDT